MSEKHSSELYLVQHPTTRFKDQFNSEQLFLYIFVYFSCLTPTRNSAAQADETGCTAEPVAPINEVFQLTY